MMHRLVSFLTAMAMLLAVLPAAFAADDPAEDHAEALPAETAEMTEKDTEVPEDPETAEKETSEEMPVYGTASGTCGDNLTWTLSDDGVLTVSGTGKMTDFNSSTTTAWYTVHDQIKSVVIEPGVTSIGNHSFNECGALASVTIPEGVTSIGDFSFNGCSALASVTIPESVTNIGGRSFYGCSALASVSISEGVTTIGENAFGRCSSLTAITLPESLTSIKQYAFYLSGLKSIVIPKNVKELGDRVFFQCKSLESAVFENYMEDLGENTFSGCTALTTVTIPESVTSIVTGFFSNCTSLKDVYYGGTEEEWKTIDIGSYAAEILENVTIHYMAFIPDAPAGLEASNRSSGVTLTWEAVSGAESYVILRDGGQIGTSAAASYTDKTAKSGAEHVYTVKAVSPGAVYGTVFDATDVCITGGISVTWDAVGHAGSYIIYRDGVQIGNSAATSFIDTEKTGKIYSASEYDYTVRAVFADKVSGESAPVIHIYLSMPANVKAANEEGGIRVSWEKVEGAGSYTVFRRSEGSSKWTAQYTTSSASTVSYLNSNAKDLDGTFYYTVRANAVKDGVSYASSKATTGTKIVRSLAPAAPVIKSVANGFSSVLVKWNRVANADGYYIYRKTEGGAWKQLKTVAQPVSGSTVSFGNTSAENGVMYTYKVVAYKASGTKVYKSSASAEKAYMRLTNPVLTAKSTTAGKISFGWTKNSAASGYQIEYTAAESFTGAERKTLNGTDKLSTAYSGFVSGQTYRVRVRAFYKYTDASGALKYCYGTWSSADESGASTQAVKVK